MKIQILYNINGVLHDYVLDCDNNKALFFMFEKIIIMYRGCENITLNWQDIHKEHTFNITDKNGGYVKLFIIMGYIFNSANYFDTEFKK